MKIFVNVGKWLRQSFLPPDIQNRLSSLGKVGYCEGDPLSGNELRKAAGDADVLFTGWGQKTVRYEDIPSCRIIAHTGGTVNGIIDSDVFDAGVTVLSGNRYYAESVAEGVIAYMMFALRRMDRYSYELKNGNWLQTTDTEGLFDQSVGIISVGAISQLVIKHLRSFRCQIKVYSTRRDPVFAEENGITYASLDEIFSTCHIVSVHTARNPQTYHMINQHHFSLLQDGALFLNTSRGAVIDEQALISALQEKRFRAVLDVYDTEPLPQDSALFGLENVTLFPHQCGPTYDRRKFITGFLIDDIESFFAGKKVENEITAEVARRMTK